MMELDGLVQIKEEPNDEDSKETDGAPGYGDGFEDVCAKEEEEPAEEDYDVTITVEPYFDDITLSESAWVKEEVEWHEEVDLPVDTLAEGSADSKEPLLLPCNVKQGQVPEGSHSNQRKHSVANQVASVSNKASTSSKQKFICNICGIKCYSAHYLSLHMGKHKTPENVNRNKKQNDRISTLVGLCGEQREAPSLFPCHLCRFKFGSNQRLIKHIKTHTDMKQLGCAYCDFKCRNKSTLNAHEKQHEYTGELCSFKCHSPGNMKRHVTKRMKKFVCHVCDAKFHKFISLKKHFERSHRGESSANLEEYGLALAKTEKLHLCTICDFKCSQEEVMWQHMTGHTGDKLYACPFCDHKYLRSAYLQKHMGTHLKLKNYVFCDVCSYKTRNQSRLREHMQDHASQELVCELCTYRTKSVKRWNLHLVSHSSGYGCDVCGDTFTSVRKLCIHKQEHVVANPDLEPLACKFCDFRCSKVDRLIAHAKTHAGE